MIDPSISVIVGQDRPRGYLQEALGSVLPEARAIGGTEVVVSLGSPDDSFREWASSHAPEVVVLPGEEHRVGRMLARAIRTAHGEVLCFLDDDDRFRPGKLRRVREAFGSDPTLAFYHHEMGFINERSAPLEAPNIRPTVQRRMRPGVAVYLPARRKPSALRHLAHVGPDFNLTSMAIRSRAIAPFLEDLENLETGPDAFLFFLPGLLSGGGLLCEGDRWSDYRLHARSLSRPGFSSVDPRHALHNVTVSLAHAESAIVDAVVRHSGPSEVVRLARANVESHRFFSALRSPRPNRGLLARALLGILPYWDTFLVRSSWLALLGSAGMLLAPRLVQRLYIEMVTQEPRESLSRP